MRSLSPHARGWPTLAAVRSPQRALVASWVVLALVASAAPARAQEESEAEGAAETNEADAAEGEATIEGNYEPDQRGETDETEEEEQGTAADSVTTAESMPASPVYQSSSGRTFGLDLTLSLGGAVTALEAAGGNVVSSAQADPVGGSLDLSAALRYRALSIGPRVALTLDPQFLLTNVAIGADWTLTNDAVAPYVRASVGLSVVDVLGGALPQQGAADILGVGVELGVGVRWSIDDGFFLGLELAGAWHHLWRAAVPTCTGSCTDGAFDLRRSGESDALQLRLSVTAGYRF